LIAAEILFQQFPLPWRCFYPLYRFLVWIYMAVWLIFHAIDPRVQGTFHWYLTNWAEVIHVFYLLTAFISSVYYGYYAKNSQQTISTQNNSSEKSESMALKNEEKFHCILQTLLQKTSRKIFHIAPMGI